MTGQAKLVIGPAALFPRVDTWSRAGLLAGFAWVDAETVADGLSLEQWQTVDARRVEPGRGGQQQRLMDYLAHLESTSSVVALWLRSPESDAAAGLASIEEFLQRVFPSITSRVRIDVINPAFVGQGFVPHAVQGWDQYLIATQDHPEVDQPDSGWTLVKDAVALHTAAALAGVLGGTAEIAASEARSRPRFVHVFSRHVGGGRRARLAAARYLDEQLPTFDAADIDPQHFGRPLKPSQVVDDCVAWLESASDGALRYTTPPPVICGQELAAEVPVPLNGWGLALTQLVSQEPIEALARKQADLAEQDDWQTQDLAKAAAKEGARPSAEVWRTVFRLITSVVDGGAPPPGFQRPNWVDRELVLQPELVDPDPAYQACNYPRELLEAYPPFQTCPPLPIGESAVADVTERLKAGPAPFEIDAEQRRNAKAIGDINTRDESIRDRQATQLRELWQKSREECKSEPAAPPLRLVDRVFRDVLRDSLLARQDGDRWRELAITPWTPDISRARRRAIALVLAGLAVIAGWTALFSILGDQINALSIQLVGSPLPGALGYALGWFIGVPLVLFGVGGLADAVRDQLLAAENSSRIRRCLTDRALTAYAEAGRLDHVARIFGLWWTIFRQLHQRSINEPLVEPPADPEVPASLQTAEPAIHVNFEPLLFAKASTEIGWRSAMIASLTSACLAHYTDSDYQDAVTELCADLGLPEGVLHRLARDLVTGAIWDEWRQTEIDRVSERILDGLVTPANRVDTPSGQTVATFLGEVLRPTSIVPGIHQLPQHVFGTPVSTRLFATEPAGASTTPPCLPLEQTPINGAAAVHVAFADVPTTSPRRALSNENDEETFSDDDLLL